MREKWRGVTIPAKTQQRIAAHRENKAARNREQFDAAIEFSEGWDQAKLERLVLAFHADVEAERVSEYSALLLLHISLNYWEKVPREHWPRGAAAWGDRVRRVILQNEGFREWMDHD